MTRRALPHSVAQGDRLSTSATATISRRCRPAPALRRFGTRYVSDAVDFIPYAVVVHPDGTETPYEEATSPEDA